MLPVFPKGLLLIRHTLSTNINQSFICSSNIKQ